MATIVNTNLAGFTVDYNGVQFGGLDAPYSSLPPTYSFEANPVPDSSGRTFKQVDCVLQVHCIFFASDRLEFTMGSIMRNLRQKLLTPGKMLKLSGLGSGFDWIPQQINTGDTIDVANGPMPLSLRMNSLGQIAWEIVWGIRFSIIPCIGLGTGTSALAFTSFNFNTTWRNDFEGFTARIINGTVTIAGIRNPASPKTVAHIAEETRGNIFISVPPNYKRVENTWAETDDKLGLSFTIVDQQLEGDPYPPGITAASGGISFQTGGSIKDSSMAKAIGTLSMSLKTAYDKPKNLAGQIFIAAALNKQAEIKASLDAAAVADTSLPKGNVIAIAFNMSHGIYDGARLTQASISWFLQQSFNTCLTACGLFNPINLTSPVNLGMTGSYAQWAASMSGAWANRGVMGMTSLASEAVIVDACDNLTAKTIGLVSSSPNSPVNANLNSLTCPAVPTNGGWIHFDLHVEPYREDKQTRHVKAASYIPSLGQTAYDYTHQPSTGNGDSVELGGPAYSQSASDYDTTEYHGYPETLIGMSFSGLRYGSVPFLPEIKSVDGLTTRLVEQAGGTPEHYMDSFGCPVWKITGWRVYSVPGAVENIKPISSLVAKDNNIPLDL